MVSIQLFSKQSILNYEVFSLRDLPAVVLAGSIFLVQYSAVLFGESLTSNHFSIFEMTSNNNKTEKLQ